MRRKNLVTPFNTEDLPADRISVFSLLSVPGFGQFDRLFGAPCLSPAHELNKFPGNPALIGH